MARNARSVKKAVGVAESNVNLAANGAKAPYDQAPAAGRPRLRRRGPTVLAVALLTFCVWLFAADGWGF